MKWALGVRQTTLAGLRSLLRPSFEDGEDSRRPRLARAPAEARLSAPTPSLTLRPATAADLPVLEALPFSGGLPSKHAQRIARQERGEALYLLACDNDRILGHLVLKWDGPGHPLVRTLVEHCAEVEDFVVDPERRSQGIGGAMLDGAGEEARARGIARLGLGVGHGNPRARALYERCGFVLVPGSDHRVTWQTIDERGRRREVFDDCAYMTKELA